MSARLDPLLFQSTTRCHSVFSCFSPAWFFHCRLVATESVATREPFEVLRTSGSAPRFPIRIALFRLRLTCTSWDAGVGPRPWTRGKCRPRAERRQPNPRARRRNRSRRRAASRALFHLEPQHQRVLARVAVVRRPLPDRAEAVSDVERLRRDVGLAHFEKHLIHLPPVERNQTRPEQRAANTAPAEFRRDGEVQHLAGAGHLASDQVAGDTTAGVGNEAKRPGRRKRLPKA